MATKINDAWKKLFEKYDILNKVKQNTMFEISAEQIKEFREPRLMTKFDSSFDLPELFEKNNLSILPISSNKYIISSNKIFNKLSITSDNCNTYTYKIPPYIESINANNITSESIALNCAYICGILADFIGDEDLVPTVSGKMGSDNFKFKIDNVITASKDEIEVNNSRIEIDGAYEGINYLTIIEAKRKITDDFIIRQLYYPFRALSKKIDKAIKLIYLVYTNGVFSLFEYTFEDADDYNSIKLLKQANYTIEDFELNIQTLTQLIESSKIIKEPDLPFPQANSFERVINLCELLNSSNLEKENVTEIYNFDSRQTDYYVNACRYLGLVEQNGEIRLTKLGQKIINASFSKRHLLLIQQILKHEVFNKVLSFSLENGRILGKENIVKIMKISNLYNIKSEETYMRRASTIKHWINWILSLLKE